MTQTKPNIVWIMADDLSWGDTGCYGQKLISTPNIDRLAAEGMLFTHCHGGSTVCAPSRSCLMQGLHSGHSTVRDNLSMFADRQYYRAALTPEDVTVAQVLKGAGYATGLFGKWGLALQNQTGQPNDAGFDEFFGYLNQRHAHSYYPPFLWHNKTRVDFPGNIGHNHLEPNDYDDEGHIIPNGVADPAKARYSYDLYHERAMDFVRARSDDEPFFLYMAYTIPHGIHEVPELGEYKDRPWPTKHKAYAAMVSRLDRSVGELLALLEEKGIDENTLIFFVSDNGYSHAGTIANPSFDDIFDHVGPFKGMKGNLSQGGVRVPAIARWPKHIATGVTSDQIWAFWDFMPTAAELAEADCPRTDGVSILPTLLGRNDHQRQHDHLYWEIGSRQAARIGRYWARRDNPSSPLHVYDAESDISEERDLAGELPEVVRQAEELFISAHVPNPQYPSPGEPREHWLERAARAGVVFEDNVYL